MKYLRIQRHIHVDGAGATNTSREYLSGWTGFVHQLLYLIGYSRYSKDDNFGDYTVYKW